MVKLYSIVPLRFSTHSNPSRTRHRKRRINRPRDLKRKGRDSYRRKRINVWYYKEGKRESKRVRKRRPYERRE